MKTTHLLLVVAISAAFTDLHRPTMAAEEIGFIERFALAADREAVLDELIPGTEDYYYFSALHHQNEGRYGEVEQVLEPWVKRHGETARVWEIRNRQALMLYPNQPEKSLAYLRERLGLRFDHQRQELGKKPNFPTALNQDLITWEKFRAREFANSSNLGGLEDSGLDRLLRNDVELDPTRRRALLARLKYPDYPNIVGLIAADLRTKESKGFGEFAIHRALLPQQLKELAGLRPDLVNNQNFVSAQLTKLAPSDDVDWRRNAAEREAYLNRMWTYLQPLSTAFNSLKAHVLYQLLVHHRQQGEYPRQLFLDYVKLPRPVPYAEPRWLNRPEHRGNAQVNLNSDYRAVTRMAPIGGRDEALVRDYLAQFFIEDETWEGFAPYIRDTWLKPVFAEAKIVNGIGDAEKWSSLLNPAAFKALRDRVDVEFVASNDIEFSVDDPVNVDLHIKNVETLMVKVYEINALNFYLEEKREINTDLNLDGLVANSEREERYEEGPLRRVRRSFEFPELAGQRGTWVIEFIGNGISSRALVRKGRLQYLAHPSAAGTVLTVLDAQNRSAKDPAVWFGGRHYTPDEKDLILLPFSNQRGSQPIVLTDGEAAGDGKGSGLATLESLNLSTENYQLEAGLHVDRETLLPGRRTVVAVRPRLTLNGAPIPTSLLENVRLQVGFVDADGIESVSDVEDFELHDDRESEYVFRVPERVRMVAFGLEAQIEAISSGGEKVDLSSADTAEDEAVFELNQIDDSEFVGDLHLAKIDGQYVVEVIGKTGEPLADRALRVFVYHRDFRETVNLSLKSGADGRVQLGRLADITRVQIMAPNLPTRSWPMSGDRHTYPASLHAAEGATISLPLMANTSGATAPKKLVPADAALFELRGGTPVDARFDALSVADGLVSIKGLAPGNYQLVVRPQSAAAGTAGRVVDLRVTRGDLTKGYVLGEDRHLQVKNPRPLQVASLSSDDEFIRIQLKNADAFTRVHVAATHYLPEYPLFPRLGTPMWNEPIAIARGASESRYVSGRDIGEEYRYILERRGKESFPGNMLTRPGLILNPWELRKTDTATVTAAAGEAYQKSEASKATSRGGAARKGGPADAFAPDESEVSRSLDFLFNQSVVSYNLAADENGVVTLKREDLGDRHHLHVLAVNTSNSAYRELSLPEADGGTEFSDLRLTRSLDVDGHFSQRRKVTMLGKGDELRIADRRASEMEVYDTLAGVYATLSGIGNDPTLAEFSFILRWPSLEAERKQELYSKYACHELNFFLSRRDPDFFATVVQPYLANKKDKTFFDDYLLEANLGHYLKAWRYGRLNTAERILLARRLGGDELDATARHIREGWELLPLNPTQQQHWFRQALRGRAGAADYGYGYGGAAGAAADSFAMEEDSKAAGSRAKRPALGALRQLSEQMQDGAESEEAPAAPAASPPPAPKSRRAFAAADKKDEAKKQVALAAVVMDTEAELAEVEELGVVVAGRELQRMRKQVRANFRKLAETSEWAENNYYQRPIGEQVAELITVNAFWRDYAAWDGQGGFYSRDFPTASTSFAEMLLALAVLDLPFEAGEHDIEIEDRALTLTAASPAVVFHEEIEAVPVAENPPPVLVSQNFFREGDRVRYEGNEQVDKFVTNEFLTGVLYGGQVVITNPTSSNQRLEVLLQIPVGALPANGSDYTRSRPVQLGAFSTERLEYFFYFPASSGDGEFAHYPVHVAKQEEAIAWADPFAFKVVDELSIIDKSSWEYLSQHGSQREVIDFLKQNNAQRIDLSLIAWRVREDVDFMRQVVKLLDARHVYDATLWSYGIHHNLVPTARQFLLHREDFLAQSGRWLECELVSIAPVERHWYQHLDYRPLVNARRHQLGRERKILNDRFRGQYQELMRVLSYRSEFDEADQLAIAGYLLLQDRVAEGLARLEGVERDNVSAQLQFDYLTAYAAFYRGEPAVAAQIAADYAEHPVDRWRERFAQVATQVAEIRGAADAPEVTEQGDRGQQQAALAATEPAFDFQVEGQRVTVTHRNLDKLQVNYYEMDLEFLFSSNPFVARDSSRFRFIRPNVTQSKPLAADKDDGAADADADAEAAASDAILAFDIPQRFRGKNVLIEIVGAGIRKAEAYYANDLSIQMVENYGHLQVRQSDNGQPLPRAYVKVYARFDDGTVKFFKDGYTDLRGKFDYVSLNTDELGAVERFAVLVMSEDQGSLVREAAPPQQ